VVDLTSSGEGSLLELSSPQGYNRGSPSQFAHLFNDSVWESIRFRRLTGFECTACSTITIDFFATPLRSWSESRPAAFAYF
jgi:hypothetical protein